MSRLLGSIVLAACLLVLATSTATARPGLAASQRTVTVATYNIHHGVGADGVLDLERIAATLEATGAQLIGLQEVDNHWGARSEFVDQAAWLGERLGMDTCYFPNLDLAPAAGQTANRQYGTAILSIHRLRDCTATPLPNHPGGEQRGLAQAYLKVRGVDVAFYNTHLTHNSRPGRVAQMDVVNDIVAHDDRPAILVGDLNARPDSPEHPVFTAVVDDVWPRVGDGPGFTYDSDDPVGRIDYILTSQAVTPLTATVVPSLASDHLPVGAELLLPHPSAVHARG